MPTNISGSGGSDREGRRPVVIDLPAEEVRKPAESDTEVAAPSTEPPAAEREAAPDAEAPAEAGAERTPDEAVIPSALATGDGDSRDAAPPARAPSARRGTSFLALLAAAVIGGVLGAGSLLAAARFGYLDGAFGGREQDPAVSAELATLRSDVAALRQATTEQGGGEVAPIQQQVAGLEQAIAELRSRPAAAGGDAAPLGEIQTRLAALEQAASNAATVEGSPALEARLGELAGQVEALQTGAGGGASEPALAGIADRIDEIAGRLGSLEGRPPVDLSGLEGDIGEIRQRLDELAGRVEAVPAEERVAALETSLSEAQADLTATAARAEAASTLGAAVVADALAAALEAGRPFATELQALRGLGLDEAALAGLTPNAEAGVATLGELRSAFEREIAAMDLRNPIPEGTGTLERLLQSARGLVEVRPANPIAGGDPGAVVARIRAALAAGDLQAALAEWSGLSEEAKAATAEWAGAAEARLAADEFVARLRSEALSRLATEG